MEPGRGSRRGRFRWAVGRRLQVDRQTTVLDRRNRDRFLVGRADRRRRMRCRDRRGHGRRRPVVDLRVCGVRPGRDPTGRSGRVVAGVGGRHTMPGAVRLPTPVERWATRNGWRSRSVRICATGGRNIQGPNVLTSAANVNVPRPACTCRRHAMYGRHHPKTKPVIEIFERKEFDVTIDANHEAGRLREHLLGTWSSVASE